jgi:putative ABC transport system substrate-binding protein
MRRRDFITLLGGAAAAWPLAARAQQPAMPVIGFLSPDTPRGDTIAAFRSGLGEAGFVERRNVLIEFRAADGDYGRLPELATDLVRRRVTAIYAAGSVESPLAAKAATDRVPVVFTVGADPITNGLVPSLSRPGGNVTGIAFLVQELGPKRLELLKELVPAARHYALLVNPNGQDTKSNIENFRSAATSIGVHIDVFQAGTIEEINTAFSAMVQTGVDALVTGSNSWLSSRDVQIATLATYHHLPAMYYNRRAVNVGGLMSYGADVLDVVRQAGVYVGRILKGEKPADLPVMQAVKFELVINAQTARVLGLTVPPSLLATADEVIE